MFGKSEGTVVSKSELMEAIWADAFVEESNLSQNIYTLRRTLGVDDEGRQFIETVPRRGYRFAVPVRLLSEVSKDSSKPTADAGPGDIAMSSNSGVPQDSATPRSLTAEASVASSLPALASAQETHTRSALRIALWTGAAVLILSALGLGIYEFVIRRVARSRQAVAPIEQVRFQRLTDSGNVVFPTISPNGELLAYVQHEEQQGSIWVKQIETGSSFQSAPPSLKGYRSLAFSPDGKYLFFREEADPGSIYQISTFGGAPRRLADNVWSDFSLSPDGKQFAFTRRDAERESRFIVFSYIDGSGEREPTPRQEILDYGTAAPAWSPDGSTIVVNVGARLRTVDVATGGGTVLKTPPWRAISRVLWMPDGEHIVFSARAPDEASSQVWMLTYPDGEVRRLTNDLEGYFWLSLTADGRMLVARQQRIVLHLWLLPDGNLKKARQLTFGERNFDGYAGLAWTPDGKIVASIFAGQNTDLYSMNADGSNRVQLTVNAGRDNTDPIVSNDGRYVVFTSNRSGSRQIWRMDIDGRNQRQLTPGEGQAGNAESAALSPRGTDVFFIQHQAGTASIWRMPIEGGSPVRGPGPTSAITGGLLAISPDGKWLAYRHASSGSETRNEDRTLSIGILPTDGGAEPKLFDLQMRRLTVQWSGDSTSFYYAAGAFDSSSLWRQPFNGDEPQKLLDFPDRVFNFAWSRDGRNLVVSRGRQRGDAILITNLP